MKSYDTKWATQLMLPYLAPAGCVVSLQNGINEDAIAAIAGWARTLGCSVSALAAELVEPGRIVRNSPLGDDKKAGMRIGEVHGQVTPRARGSLQLLAHWRHLQGDHQPVGRALVQADDQRHAQRRLRVHRSDGQAARHERPWRAT